MLGHGVPVFGRMVYLKAMVSQVILFTSCKYDHFRCILSKSQIGKEQLTNTSVIEQYQSNKNKLV